MDYNVVVIGAGSAGLVSAYICAAIKARVALIEKNKMGGDCLNTGCVPSKAFIRSTTVLSVIERCREFGLSKVSCEFDFARIMERVQRVIRKVEPHDSAERYRSLGVDCLQGDARILSPHEVEVDGRTVTAKNIIVATGAAPAIPSIPGLDRIRYYHTDNIWELRKQPKRLLVIGGGPIGCELGQCFARLGTKVNQIQTASQLLNREDQEVIDIVHKRLVKEGVEIHLKTKLLEIISRGAKNFAMVEENGDRVEIEFDEILLAVGRKPRVSGFGLEELGIELNEKGAVVIDAYGRTNVKNIFACGDVTGKYQFTHAAAHEAWYCAVNALFQPLKKFKVDWSLIPWCTFTDPEVAHVGLNEKEAAVQRIPYEVTVFRLDELDRAIADEEDEGLVKVLTKPGRDEILGVTICGYHAGDLMAEFVLAMKYGIGLNRILNTIHIYPTMAEANKYAAGVWKKAHAPEFALRMIEKYHGFRRQ